MKRLNGLADQPAPPLFAGRGDPCEFKNIYGDDLALVTERRHQTYPVTEWRYSGCFASPEHRHEYTRAHLAGLPQDPQSAYARRMIALVSSTLWQPHRSISLSAS